MMRGIVFAIMILVATVSAAMAQQPDPICGERQAILLMLKSQHKMSVTDRGVFSGSMIEIVSAPSGLWLMLITVGNGQACIAMHGDGWHHVAKGNNS